MQQNTLMNAFKIESCFELRNKIYTNKDVKKMQFF